MIMKKNRRKHLHRFRCYRCVVIYLDYVHDGLPSQVRTLHYAVDVRYFDRFLRLIDDTFDFYTISCLSTFYSSVNRDFYSLL